MLRDDAIARIRAHLRLYQEPISYGQFCDALCCLRFHGQRRASGRVTFLSRVWLNGKRCRCFCPIHLRKWRSVVVRFGRGARR